MRLTSHRTHLARDVQEALTLAASAEKRFDLLGLRGRKADIRFIRRPAMILRAKPDFEN
jgi:hypothetical protein